MKTNLDAMPAELRQRAQWVAYRLEPSKTRPGKTDKIPVNPHTGALASTTDPATWGTLEEAAACAEKRGLAGVGYVFNGDHVFIDLDDCIDADGNIAAEALEIVNELKTYTEYSQSGRGLHLIARGALPEGRRRKSGLEMYDVARFAAMTGKVLAPGRGSIEARQAEINALHARIFGQPRPQAVRTHVSPTLADDELLAKARSANNGPGFVALFDQGDMSGYPSQSEADEALCFKLAFWTSDAAQVDRLFRQSALMRDKWEERADYRDNTIKRALEKVTTRYQPTQNGHHQAPRVIEEPPAEEPEPPAEPVAPLPSLGWIDDLTGVLTWLSGAPLEFNRLCALVTTATAIQHRAVLRMSFADVRPNLYGCIVAMSTVYHKSASLRLIRRLLRRADLDELLLAELMTSEGLLRQLQNQPAGVIVRDEIGTLFGSDRIKYLAQLKQDLTALYDGDPYSRQLSQEKITVQNPYLNICGATTPAKFYESVSFNDWHDGFLARWLFVLAPEGEPCIELGGGQLTPGDDAGIGEMASKLSWIGRQQATDFSIQPDAFTHWAEWYRTSLREAHRQGDDVLAALTGRNTTYALKFAILLAAVNGTWGRITDEEMTPAILLAEHYLTAVKRLRDDKQDFGVNGAKLQKVFALIGANPGITTKQLQQQSHIRASDLTPVLEKLIEIGAITSEKAGKGWRYTTTSDRLPIRSW